MKKKFTFPSFKIIKSQFYEPLDISTIQAKFFEVLARDFFLIGIHSMQGTTTTMRHGVNKKKSTKSLKHTGNLFRKNLHAIC